MVNVTKPSRNTAHKANVCVCERHTVHYTRRKVARRTAGEIVVYSGKIHTYSNKTSAKTENGVILRGDQTKWPEFLNL